MKNTILLIAGFSLLTYRCDSAWGTVTSGLDGLPTIDVQRQRTDMPQLDSDLSGLASDLRHLQLMCAQNKTSETSIPEFLQQGNTGIDIRPLLLALAMYTDSAPFSKSLARICNQSQPVNWTPDKEKETQILRVIDGISNLFTQLKSLNADPQRNRRNMNSELDALGHNLKILENDMTMLESGLFLSAPSQEVQQTTIHRCLNDIMQTLCERYNLLRPKKAGTALPPLRFSSSDEGPTLPFPSSSRATVRSAPPPPPNYAATSTIRKRPQPAQPPLPPSIYSGVAGARETLPSFSSLSKVAPPLPSSAAR